MSECTQHHWPNEEGKCPYCEIERLRAVITPLKPCKVCNGSGAESNMWRDKKNGCGRCNGYGWVLTGNRDNFREAIAAARRALGGEKVVPDEKP